jgi:hypothetical protein
MLVSGGANSSSDLTGAVDYKLLLVTLLFKIPAAYNV